MILHAFTPGGVQVRQKETWSMLEQLRRHGRHVVIDWPTAGDFGYAAALQWCWNRGRQLIVLEGDVVPNLEDLVQLERCSVAQICTQAIAVGGIKGYTFRVRQEDGSLRWGQLGDHYADTFPLACTIFRGAAMTRVPEISSLEHWHGLDHWLSMQMTTRAHVHWPPIRHNHSS